LSDFFDLAGVARRQVHDTKFWISATAIAVIGVAIAALAPFDRAFDHATLGSPIVRAGVLALIVLIGLLFAMRLGAPIESRGLKHPIITPLLIAAAMGVYVTVLDLWVFRAVLDPGYFAFISGADLGYRLTYFMLRAFNESILYRLFLSTALVWAVGLIWRGRDGRPANGAYWVAIVVAQAANIAINATFATGASPTPWLLLHDGLRYVVPGVVWGYLYFRHGFTTHEIAAVGTHLFFQPLLSLALQ
jgi:hypothetical protein